jgi:hypothetical protein
VQICRTPFAESSDVVVRLLAGGQNYAMAIAVNAFAPLLGAGEGLSPVLAAIPHNAPSVAVVANSSRLMRYQITTQPQPTRDNGCTSAETAGTSTPAGVGASRGDES